MVYNNFRIVNVTGDGQADEVYNRNITSYASLMNDTQYMTTMTLTQDKILD